MVKQQSHNFPLLMGILARYLPVFFRYSHLSMIWSGDRILGLLSLDSLTLAFRYFFIQSCSPSGLFIFGDTGENIFPCTLPVRHLNKKKSFTYWILSKLLLLYINFGERKSSSSSCVGSFYVSVSFIHSTNQKPCLWRMDYVSWCSN